MHDGAGARIGLAPCAMHDDAGARMVKALMSGTSQAVSISIESASQQSSL